MLAFDWIACANFWPGISDRRTFAPKTAIGAERSLQAQPAIEVLDDSITFAGDLFEALSV
jgi:hypothetical protein